MNQSDVSKSATNKTKVYICVGSGGVGKTSVAASLGYHSACLGHKTLVLTIDPAQRLKTTLNITQSRTEIKDPNLKAAFFAEIIDPKKTFDEFVTRASKKSETVARLLKNKLYQQLSGGLSGSQEFTAMEKLYSAYDSQEYDVIVLDTPPTKHAMDFLIAPQKISTLFQEAISKWLRAPEKGTGFFRNIVQFSTKKVLKILELLTGNEFIQNLRDFFESIQEWQGSLEARTKSVHNLLIDPETHFILVTGFDRAKLMEADFFINHLKQGGYHLSSIIVNRAFPEWLHAGDFDRIKAQNPTEEKLLQIVKYHNDKLSLYQRFFQQNKNLDDGAVKVNYIPELNIEISDLNGVRILSNLLAKQEIIS